MTRAKVLQLGFAVLLLGGIGYFGFRIFGFDSAKAGIASEAILLFLVISWVSTYFFRVVTGKMTFMEQRNRYRKAYEELTTSKLQSSFDSLSVEEKTRLLQEIEKSEG